MNILQTLQQLRDDLKFWVTNNLNALNAKIDEKTIPIDNELDSNSTNPVQNKVVASAINNIPKFSGDYSDLINAPNITDDESGNMVITDESGNIIFKADADGVHTTSLSLNGENAATESYVDEVIANIDISAVDLTGYATEQWVENKNYLTEHQDISGKSDVGHKHVIADITDVPDYVTKEYVDNAVDSIEIPEVDFTGYATETYVDNKVADLVNSAPEALNTLGELATALENHEDAYDALLETVGSKATTEDLENFKAEISESIVSETDEFHIVDEAGNIVASIDTSGVATTTVTAQSIIVNGDNVEEHIDNTEIHVTAAEKEVWNKKSNFSGSYNDLTDKPASTDLSNYYTKTEVDEAIDNVDVDLTGYATEEYVTNAINGIDIPETDLSGYYTKTETDTAIESAKEELSESIVSESEEWHIVDNNGNIVVTIDVSGISTTTVAAQNITVNGLDIEELIQARVQAYIDQAILGGEW